MKLENLGSICFLAVAVTANTAWAQAQPAPPISGVLRMVQSFAGGSLDVATASGVVHAQ